MISIGLLIIAFSSGVAVFFSPCSVALLPAYVSYNLSDQVVKGSGFTKSLIGLRFGTLAALGVLTVFLLFGAAFSLLGNFIAPYARWVAMATGAGLILLGSYLFTGKKLTLPIPHSVSGNKGYSGHYLFGVAYALGSLGCTLPIFIIVISQALSFGSFSLGMLTFLVFSAGTILLMIAASVGATVSKTLISNYLNVFMPVINRVSPIIIILAGAYLIYFQLKAFYF